MDFGYFELSLGVQDLKRSCDFYSLLGFQLADSAPKHQTAHVQRGDCRIGLYQGRPHKTTLIFRQGDVEAIGSDLTTNGLRFERGPVTDEKGTNALIRDPDGLAVYFVNVSGEARKGPATKLDAELGWFEPSLHVQDIKRTREFYEALGFQIVNGSDNIRRVTLQKNDCRICLYQGYLEPAETQLIFWQGDVEVIARDLTKKGLRFENGPATDEKGPGALLKDPDGVPIYFVNITGVVRKEPI